MFEYLMSELFMRAPEGSLLSQTNQAVVAAQKQHRGAGVFGVSESGYNAFDLQMNYQYRAFGLPALSLRGDADAMVIAPYASMLALPVDQAAALDNLNRMKDLNWTSEYGLYEAVDFAPPRLPEGAKYRVVFSHMAHHQGMILGAVANALAGDFLVRAYMGKPCTRAVSLLLEERRQARPALKQRKGPQNQPQIKRPIGRTARAAKPDAALPDAHLLYGGGATCFLTAGGGGYLKCNGTLAARFTGLLRAENDGLFVHVYLPAKKRAFLASGQMEQPGWLSQRASFDAGSATWMSRTADLEARLTACVSPEDGALLQKVELTSHAQSAMTVELTGCFAVALCAQADLTAHPAFQNLFVESAPLGDDAILFRRRSRGGERHPLLISLVAGAGGERIQRETDLQRLTGREGALGRPGGLKSGFTERFGRTLNPCSALRVRLHLKAGERRSLSFVTGIAPSEEEALKLYKRHAASEAAGRALLLSGTQARAMLDFLGLDAAQHHMLQRASALLTYPRLSARSGGEAGGLSVSGLWALGVSGDLPIIAVFVSAKEQMELVRSALRMHEFYRTMGVWCDLLLINDYGNDYEQPVRDALRELIAASHLRDLTLEPGGVFPLEGATLTEAQRETIAAFASIALRGRSGGMEAQLQKQLSHAPLPEGGREALPSVRMRPDGYGLAPIERMNFNGWGGFLQDGAYAIDLLGGKPTPSAWCNLLSNERFGSLVSERGGGFTWANNSYSGRLTPFGNDPLREGAGERLYLYGEKSFASLLPDMDFLISPLRVVHRPGMSAFASGAGALSFQVTEFVDRDLPVKCLRVAVKNAGGQARDLRLRLEVDWLMGTYPADLRLMRHLPAPPGAPAPMALSRGAMEGVGFASAQTGRALPGGGLEVSFRLESGQTWQGDLLLGWGRTIEDCKNICVHWRDEDRLETALAAWADRLSRLEVLTPDPLINLMLTKWLPYQALSGRIWGRAGLYQPGGAYGFRDQLQDMLCMIPIEPGLVRAHLIECCRHQFESGDVQHWWHPNSAGVRTRISDDLLFLPYVAAQYVLETGDEGVLSEEAPYLRDVEIEDGREDYYGEAGLSDWTESLNDHCLRAIRRACRFGPHGLPLMGSGDWNDGMNRVGARGQGESVWLGEFLAATCECYAEICPGEAEKKELLGLRDQMKAAVEEHGWDGQWYRRAFYDDGSPLGSASGEGGCMIDAIAQSWAVMAGLNPARSRQAMDSVWKELVDPAHGIIKLLTPPFDENGRDPGYIRGYPPGVRENGGQYTHAACWVLMAYAQLGDAKRAWQALNMLMPYAHSASSEQAKIYRVEPYVLSGDVYGEPPHAGRGGWTWYTGAASWLCRAAIRYLLGYERRGGRARLNALLPDDWDETSLRVRVGQARYTLTARKGEARISLDGRAVEGEWIDLTDDGAEHQAVFPPRQA